MNIKTSKRVKSSLSPFVIIFLTVMYIFSTNLMSDTIPNTDHFHNSLDGWQGDSLTKDYTYMYINGNKSAYKQYDFNSSYAYRDVTIEIRLKTDSATTGLYIYKDDKQIKHAQDKLHYRRFTVTINTTLDKNGKIKLTLEPDAKDDNAYVGIDFVKINDSNRHRNFTMEKLDNIKGNVVMIGNSVLIGKDNTCANTRIQNNYINAQYADMDDDDDTYNSTSANLVLPKGVKSDDILYALLYWQGRTTVNNAKELEDKGKYIKIKFFGSSSYKKITSDPSKFNYHIGVKFHDYQGTADITDSLKASLDNLKDNELENSGYNKPVWVADLFTNKGTNRYGAWSLIVTYKDKNEELRNITLFDGYDQLHSTKKSYLLSGFLTPANGEVKAKFMVFAGEGDVAYGDSVKLRDKDGNDILLEKDFFHSSEDIDGKNIINRNPNCSNTIGIDLRTVSVGTDSGKNIIGNKQKTTKVTLIAESDEFFPGVFIFSTQLYKPRVCYYIDKIKEGAKTVFKDGKFTKKINRHSKYTYYLWVGNIKRDANDTGTEDATKVQVNVSTNDFRYSQRSTYIKNIGYSNYKKITDESNDDIGEYNPSNKMFTWRLGRDANATDGGEIGVGDFNKGDKAYVKLDGKFLKIDSNQTEIDIANYYSIKASYASNGFEIKSENAIQLDICKDINTTAEIYIPKPGHFNVVNENFSLSDVSDDLNNSNDANNSLYTQIVGKSFNVKILSLIDDGSDIRQYKGDINVTIIPTPTSSDACKNNIIANINNNNYAAVTFNDDMMISRNFIYGSASKSVSFGIQYKVGDENKFICSLDSFAVRPESYNIEINGTKLIGKRVYRLDINATKYNSVDNVTGYNQSFTNTNDKNLTAKLNIPSGCTLSSNTQGINTDFSNGQASEDYNYLNVGDINITIFDSNWTAVDQVPKTYNGSNSDSIDCIKDSNANIPDSSHRIGCAASTTKQFTFLPKEFKNQLDVENFNNTQFTYISSDGNMSAIFKITIKAILDDNSTATNYTAKCFSNDINTTIKLISEPPANEWLTNDSNATARIVYFDDKKITTSKEINGTGWIIYSSREGNFSNGEANIYASFNFKREVNSTDEPFHIRKNDFNITVIDTNDVNGSDFNRTNDKNITFYYGRIHAPDYSSSSDTIKAIIYYENYCKNCDKTKFTLVTNADESIDSVYWYINNAKNNMVDGNITNFVQPATTKLDISPGHSVAIANGEETQTIDYNGNKYPYKERVEMNASKWLIYNPYEPNATTESFSVEFSGVGNWAGVGNTGRTVDINISSKGSKRIEW